MQVLSWTSIVFYCAFSIFIYYQTLHSKNFQGASEVFGILLSFSSFVGMLVGFSYLIYYGWSVVWWVPFIIFIIGLLAGIPGFIIERLIGPHTLSFSGFIGWPICAYFMFRYIPVVA